MLSGSVFERFMKKTPFAVMSRTLLERALTAEALDALFEEKADSQYKRELTFSSVVDLMGQVAISTGTSRRPSGKSTWMCPKSASRRWPGSWARGMNVSR